MLVPQTAFCRENSNSWCRRMFTFFQVTIYEVSVINLSFLILQRTNVHVNLLSFCLKYKVHLRNTHRVLPIEQKFWFEILEIPHS